MSEDTKRLLYVVICSEREKPLSHPMPRVDAEMLADYYNNNQGEDYCIGDHDIREYHPQPP